jgi:CheY-like chemotaxis protein
VSRSRNWSSQKAEADLRLTVQAGAGRVAFSVQHPGIGSLARGVGPAARFRPSTPLAQHLRATLPKLRAATGAAQSTLGEQFAICASYLELMQVRLGERLHVDVRLPPELRDAVPAVPAGSLLVENAIKHGVEPKPGVTRVALAARVVAEGERKQLEVQVEDDGAGLKLGMGEGTGLANIRAQLLTRFASAASLELGARRGRCARASCSAAGAGERMTGPTAIMAEDEAPQRQEMRTLLAEMWPQLSIVGECEDGLSALEALEQHRPRIAFLDIRMPGVSGLEVARAAGSQCHVIFVTAYDEYALQAFDEGALDFCSSPLPASG